MQISSTVHQLCAPVLSARASVGNCPAEVAHQLEKITLCKVRVTSKRECEGDFACAFYWFTGYRSLCQDRDHKDLVFHCSKPVSIL